MDYSQLTDHELVELIAARITETGALIAAAQQRGMSPEDAFAELDLSDGPIAGIVSL